MNIKVDQSYCTKKISNELQKQEFDIFFVDRGRVSRGGFGVQGASLRVFEKNSLPIPDIVAIKDGNLLIVEVDHTIAKSVNSLTSYINNEQIILNEFKAVSQEFSNHLLLPQKILIGFGKIGLTAEMTDSLNHFEFHALDSLSCVFKFSKKNEDIFLNIIKKAP